MNAYEVVLFGRMVKTYVVAVAVLTIAFAYVSVLRSADVLLSGAATWFDFAHLFVVMTPYLVSQAVPFAATWSFLQPIALAANAGELRGLLALGYPQWRLVPLAALWGGLNALLMAVLLSSVVPPAQAKTRRIVTELVKQSVVSELTPGVVREVTPGVVAFTRTQGEGGDWRDLFLHDSRSRELPQVLFAPQGRLHVSSRSPALVLELPQGGEIHPEQAGTHYRLVHFSSAEVSLNVIEALTARGRGLGSLDEQSSWALVRELSRPGQSEESRAHIRAHLWAQSVRALGPMLLVLVVAALAIRWRIPTSTAIILSALGGVGHYLAVRLGYFWSGYFPKVLPLFLHVPNVALLAVLVMLLVFPRRGLAW